MDNTFGIFKSLSENYRDIIKEEPLYYKDTTSMYDRATAGYADVEDIMHQALIHKGPVLELCCGTGRLTLPLLKKRLKVTAVDLSEDMLSVLKNAVESNRMYSRFKDYLTIIRGDMNDIDKLEEKYNFVVIGATSIRLMENDFCGFFNKVYGILNPGGAFFFDFEDIPIRNDIGEMTEPLHMLDIPAKGGELVLEIFQRHIDYKERRAYVNLFELKFPGEDKQLISYTQYRIFGVDEIKRAADESMFKGCRLIQRPDGIWNCVLQKGMG